jgi:hypothetical protein
LIREARPDETEALAELQPEVLGWHENGDTRLVPFPPNPIDIGYTIELETTLATP